jgi:hypothetical protein
MEEEMAVSGLLCVLGVPESRLTLWMTITVLIAIKCLILEDDVRRGGGAWGGVITEDDVARQ